MGRGSQTEPFQTLPADQILYGRTPALTPIREKSVETLETEKLWDKIDLSETRPVGLPRWERGYKHSTAHGGKRRPTRESHWFIAGKPDSKGYFRVYTACGLMIQPDMDQNLRAAATHQCPLCSQSEIYKRCCSALKSS